MASAGRVLTSPDSSVGFRYMETVIIIMNTAIRRPMRLAPEVFLELPLNRI